MFVPFFSNRNSSPSSKRKLYRRKGGGGIGRGGGSSGGSGGKSGTGGGSARSGSVSTPVGSKSATSFGNGGGKPITIPSGSLFAGRTAGGATRAEVYGNRQYGSGYPGVTGRGVANRNFPFVFWPLAWGGAAAIGTTAYLHNNEYGRFDNSSRPGGIMMMAVLQSNTQNTTFRLLSDNSTVISLIEDIQAGCNTTLKDSGSIAPTPYNDSLPAPKPEQTVQYYRASSVALTLDGYNNTADLEQEGAPDTPLPSNIDMNLLNCLNSTIGDAVPLVDGTGLGFATPSNMGLLSLVYVIWTLTSVT